MMAPDPYLANGMVQEVNSRLDVAIAHVLTEVIDSPLGALERSTSPAVHALQALVREAAVAGDMTLVEKLFADHRPVLARQAFADRCHVIPWGNPDLSAGEFDLLQSAFQDDIGLTAKLAPPSAARLDVFHQTFDLLRATLPRHLPLWWQELEALVAIILLAESDDKNARFGGASAFAAWGAILVNPANSPTPLSLALTLVHESSHLKLFHAYLDDEIVLNDADARYASPLRRDGRPMNGIYHATYVLARMLAFLSDLGRSDQALSVLGPGAAGMVQAELPRLATAFDEGFGVIASDGVLTPKGRAIMDEAFEAVQSCLSSAPVS